MLRVVVTIDGPAGSGKSTVAPRLAEQMGWSHFDSGALYRVLAWLALQRGLDVMDSGSTLVEIADEIGVSLEGVHPEQRYLVGGEDVTDPIRSPEVSRAASRVATDADVRAWVVRRLRSLATEVERGIVAEGRDMGTVVFPEATVKVFLEASLEERARRRQEELQARGYSQSLETVRSELLARDDADRNRALGPMVPAEDAIRLDTTELSVEKVTARVGELIGRAVGQNINKTKENAG